MTKQKYYDIRLGHRADWLHEAGWGVFCHYLADKASSSGAIELSVEQWNRRVESFDVQRLAGQLESVGALAQKNIRTIVYTASGAPQHDALACEKLHWRFIPPSPATSWDTIRESGLRGGKKYVWDRTPGFGDTNWTDVISILRQHGWRGAIDIEGYHDPAYSGDLEWTGQVHGLNYLKQCRGGSYVEITE